MTQGLYKVDLGPLQVQRIFSYAWTGGREMKSSRIQNMLALLVLEFLFRVVEAQATNEFRQPYAIVHPVSDHTKLLVDNDGLDVLRRINGPVAPVVVIGPYRSGKSFTLNQLLGVGCDEGFGVGHSRQTQTKGVWVWGEPIAVRDSADQELNLVFFDTEGFESTGKADAYDDRIFALSTLISSVLIYNLPESIRESDVEKLSFAAELASAFYGKAHQGGQDLKQSVQPGAMIWLIQRDFLQGDSLAATLQAALDQVPNPYNDPAIEQLNRIRNGLRAIASNSTALGLPQPHIERTRLCEIPDDQLDPEYLAKRESLKQTVFHSAAPKYVRGTPLTGESLANLIQETVTALNDREIPTSGSLVRYFNRELVDSCRQLFGKLLEEKKLPVETIVLETFAEQARKKVEEKFENEKFGYDTQDLRQSLAGALDKEYAMRQAANTYESAQVCDAAELECEMVLEHEASQRLPSTGRFSSRYQRCEQQFNSRCVGPSKSNAEVRLQHAWDRENARFVHDYNDKLYNGLVILSVAVIVIFRFIVRWSLAETGGWIAFIFLQIYPNLFLASGSSMYETSGWHAMVVCWEFIANNPIIDLERFGLPLTGIALVAYITRQRWWWRCRSLCCFGRRKLHQKSKNHLDRDLDV